MTDQQAKARRILKGVGYTDKEILFAHDPFVSYPICFEHIVPMMEREGFSLSMSIGKDHCSANFYRFYKTAKHGDPGKLNFRSEDKDIRIAICEACNQCLLSKEETK